MVNLTCKFPLIFLFRLYIYFENKTVKNTHKTLKLRNVLYEIRILRIILQLDFCDFAIYTNFLLSVLTEWPTTNTFNFQYTIFVQHYYIICFPMFKTINRLIELIDPNLFAKNMRELKIWFLINSLETKSYLFGIFSFWSHRSLNLSLNAMFIRDANIKSYFKLAFNTLSNLSFFCVLHTKFKLKNVSASIFHMQASSALCCRSFWISYKDDIVFGSYLDFLSFIDGHLRRITTKWVCWNVSVLEQPRSKVPVKQ